MARIQMVPFPGIWVLAVLILLALIAGRRSRSWWWAVGCVMYCLGLAAAWARGDPHGLGWIGFATWLACIVFTAIALPLLLARDRLGTRPVLAVGVLLGGLAGGSIIAIYGVGLTCTLTAACGDTVNQDLMPRYGGELDTIATDYELPAGQPDAGSTPAERKMFRSELLITMPSQFHESPTPSGEDWAVYGPGGERVEFQAVLIASDSSTSRMLRDGYQVSGGQTELLLLATGVPAAGTHFVRVELSANMRVAVARVRWSSGHQLMLGI